MPRQCQCARWGFRRRQTACKITLPIRHLISCWLITFYKEIPAFLENLSRSLVAFPAPYRPLLLRVGEELFAGWLRGKARAGRNGREGEKERDPELPPGHEEPQSAVSVRVE